MEGSVTVKMNVLGIDLNINQIDAVLANENNDFNWQRNWLTSFFQLDSPSELTKCVLARYAEADKYMARISVGTNQADIYDRLINTLVSAKRCYSNAEYLACIELCALHSEMLANYLCITSKENLELVFSNLPREDRESIDINKSTGIYFSDKIPQTIRLRWLVKGNVTSADDRKRMLTIHNLRIKYFHHWSPKRGHEQQDAIKALSALSPVTAKFLEILGSEPRTYNTVNLERIKRYMKIVLGESYGCNISPRKMKSACEFFSKLWSDFLKLIRIKYN